MRRKEAAMSILSPSRLIAAAATAIAALGLGVAYASTGSNLAPAAAGKKACVHGQAQLRRNKETVVAFYTTAFNDKQPERAVRRYVGLDNQGRPLYIQHNPFAADGAQAFIDFVNLFAGTYPQMHVDIRRVIAECDLVVTHSLFTLGPPDTSLGSVAADILRLDENGKIVEHWDAVQPIEANPANSNGQV
jgi:predicted SnoaL-like aldol condensation-catalyzing enzyme